MCNFDLFLLSLYYKLPRILSALNDLSLSIIHLDDRDEIVSKIGRSKGYNGEEAVYMGREYYAEYHEALLNFLNHLEHSIRLGDKSKVVIK